MCLWWYCSPVCYSIYSVNSLFSVYVRMWWQPVEVSMSFSYLQLVLLSVGSFNQSNIHRFTWFDNLPTPRSYWFVLITQRNNTNKEEEKTLLNSTLHNSSSPLLSLVSLCVFTLLCHTSSLSSSLCLIIDKAWGKKSRPSITAKWLPPFMPPLYAKWKMMYSY